MPKHYSYSFCLTLTKLYDKYPGNRGHWLLHLFTICQIIMKSIGQLIIEHNGRTFGTRGVMKYT